MCCIAQLISEFIFSCNKKPNTHNHSHVQHEHLSNNNCEAPWRIASENNF